MHWGLGFRVEGHALGFSGVPSKFYGFGLGFVAQFRDKSSGFLFGVSIAIASITVT